MKVLLIAINAKYIHSNLAVYSLKESAGQWKDQVEIAEYTINHRREEILADIYRKKPDVAAFSCYIWNLEYVQALTRELSKILPEVPIWLGGPEVSFDCEERLKNQLELTGILYGEGESSFRELLAWYHEGGTLSSVRGLVFREKQEDGSEVICRTAPRDYEDLDKLPFVYHDLTGFDNRIIYYESSRGCPFSCSYCLSSVDKRVRFRSLSLVKKELAFFLEKKVPQVKFVDRTFNVNHNRTMEILRFIREHDNQITNFHFEISADLLNEEEIAFLGTLRPGLVQLEIGVQSTDGSVLHAIHRNADFEKIAENVRKIRKPHNVHQHLDLIAGLPYGTMEEFQKSFNEVYALRPSQFQLGFLKVLKGSEMAERKQEFSLVNQSLPPYEVLSTAWLSYEELLRLKGVEEMVEVYYNSSQFARSMELLEQGFSSAFELYDRLAGFYEEEGYTKKSHSRMDRFLILRLFGRKWLKGRETELDQALIVDLYAREKSKSRPFFAPDLHSRKEDIYEFYKKEAREHRYLPEDVEMSARQLMNQTHLEILPGEKERWLLFDYRKRDPLTKDGRILEVEPEVANGDKTDKRNS